VVEEQNPDGFPSHAWDQSALHRFLGHQSHGPAGAALWRVTAHHGDNPLFLAIFQNSGGAWPLLLVESGFEAAGLVTMADLPNRLGSERDHAGNPRRTNAPGQLPERQGSQDHTDLLNAAAQQPRQLVLVFRFDFDTQRWASHTLSMRQNIFECKCFLESFQAVRDLELRAWEACGKRGLLFLAIGLAQQQYSTPKTAATPKFEVVSIKPCRNWTSDREGRLRGSERRCQSR